MIFSVTVRGVGNLVAHAAGVFAVTWRGANGLPFTHQATIQIRLNTSVLLVPPKPNELLNTALIGILRAVFGT